MFDWEVFEELPPGRIAWIEDKARRHNRKTLSVMEGSTHAWYVLLVEPQKEFVVQRILGLRGIPAYVRFQRKWRRVNRYIRRKIRIAYPLMSGYVFIGQPRGQEKWWEVLNLRSVSGVLGVDGRPAAFASQSLYQFITGCCVNADAPSEQRYMRTHHEFTVGDCVRIVEGAFDGHVVDVKDIRGPNAYILMDLMGSIQNIEISLDRLEKVG